MQGSGYSVGIRERVKNTHPSGEQPSIVKIEPTSVSDVARKAERAAALKVVRRPLFKNVFTPFTLPPTAPLYSTPPASLDLFGQSKPWRNTAVCSVVILPQLKRDALKA